MRRTSGSAWHSDLGPADGDLAGELGLFGISLGWTALMVISRFSRDRVARRNRILKRAFLIELLPVMEAGQDEAALVKRLWRSDLPAWMRFEP